MEARTKREFPLKGRVGLPVRAVALMHREG
jgi:hypothetical protein